MDGSNDAGVPAEWLTLPKTAAEAREIGSVRFYPATRCKRGHVSDRYTQRGICCTCARENTKKTAAARKWATITQADLKADLRYWPYTGRFTRVCRDGKYRGKRLFADDYINQGYRWMDFLGGRFVAHRLAWLYMKGEFPPEGMVIDHINGDRSDNSWRNLRLATFTQNLWNTKKKSDNSTGFKGVSRTPGGRFVASICCHGKSHNLGTYDDPEEAHAAYVAAAQKMFGEYANAG